PSLSPHCGARRVLPSCPTRRSSDLDHFIRRPDGAGRAAALSEDEVEARAAFVRLASLLGGVPTDLEAAEGYLTYYEEVTNRPGRSEEHTSELQSRENLVCRLLLEKK